MLYILYNTLIIMALLVFSPVWLILIASKKKFRAGFFQKCGFLPDEILRKIQLFTRKPVWFHAVSVGECLAIIDLVKEFNRQMPDVPVVVTTVTYTGQQIALKRLGNIATVFYFPFDIGFITTKIINIVNPCVILIVETELWPNFSRNAFCKGIPLLLINGRISPKSFKNYLKFDFFVRRILSFFSLFLMQSAVDADRIIQMGADSAKVQVVGNIKYDITPGLSVEQGCNLKAELEIDDSDNVIIAGSTHSGEEELLINTFIDLSAKIDNLKLILVPRHPERYGQVMDLLKAKNLSFGRRTDKNTLKTSSILLLDTMGELSNFYAVAKLAFIGGSYVEKGGHNPLEPAIYGVPVIMGVYTFNFADISDYMERMGALIRINNQHELSETIYSLLTKNEQYFNASKACSDVFISNRGSTKVILDNIYNKINL